MKYFVPFLLFLSIATVCYAEDLSITADTDKQEVTLDEQVTLTITVSGSVSNIPQPDIPDLKGFTAYSSGRSQNISIINGQISSSVSFTYILVPNDTGDYTLGPFSINYQAKAYSTGPINIKVLPRTSQQRQQAPSYTYPQQPQEPQEEGVQPQHGKELFIETYVDKLRAYVNEQITLTFAFYQSVDLFENPVYNPPSTTGFWTEDMPPQKKYYKMIDGTRYLVTEIKTALFGTSPGEFTIGSARLEASIEDLQRFFSRRAFDIFDTDPFSMFKRGKPIILTTDPIKVGIMSLPEENKPLDFKGDVGRFDISADIDKNMVEENQPVTLKIRIKGSGNIKTVSSPVIPQTQDVKLYESGSSENISKEDYIVQGEKTFEKVIIPKKEGDFTIGPIEYTYFDPIQKDYVRKKLNPVTISATKSKEEPLEKTLSIPGATKEDIELLKKDIAYIKTFTPRFESRAAFLYKNRLFLLLNILPFFILIALYLNELHRNRLKTDVGYARSLRARGAASRRLRGSRDLMQKGMVKEFYAEIYKAVIEYIGDRLNIPHASITKDALEEKLRDSGTGQEHINRVRDLFDICDMARFASANLTKDDMRKTMKDAEYLITVLERFI